MAEIRREYPPVKEEDYSLDYRRLDRELGPKKFGDLCKRVRGPLGDFILEKKKYGERWIQARGRLGLRVPNYMPSVSIKG